MGCRFLERLGCLWLRTLRRSSSIWAARTLLRETRIDFEGALSWLLGRGEQPSTAEIQADLRALYLEIRKSLRAGQTEFSVRGLLRLAHDLTGQVAAKTDFEALELQFWKRVAAMEPLPGVSSVLVALQDQGIELGVVSNSMFSSHVLRYELERNGLLAPFRFVVSSADYGIQKPHPMIFKAASALLACEASETWFVGDNFENDVLGAASVGMRSIWITGPSSNRELPSDSRRIESWEEFLPLLSDA